MSDYDAASVIEEREGLASPRWKRIDCPTCGMAAGFRCMRERMGDPGRFEAVAPHVARKRAAAAAGILR